MGYTFEAILPGDRLFEFRRKTILNFHNTGTLVANQMVVVVPMTVLADQFEARHAITKIKSLNKLDLLQHTQRSIDCGQVTLRIGQRIRNLLDRQRAPHFSQ